MDIRLREIAAQAAGTYFLLTDNSPVPENFETSKLRLFPIVSNQGPVNTVVLFKKGEKTAFQNIFGKRLRKNEKLGNFSIYNVLEALNTSDIGVINLRKFTSEDKIGVAGLNPNYVASEAKEMEYQNIFNRNGLWTIKAKNIVSNLSQEHLLNFANVGKNNLSFFVVKSKEVDSLTNSGDLTLTSTPLEIEEYPALNPEMLLRDTFVDVYIFNNTFTNTSQNKYYGQYFEPTGLLKVKDISELTKIKEAGFVKKISGSLIPNLVNEQGEVISIDTLVNKYYAETGLVCYINDEVLENEKLGGTDVINTLLKNYYNLDGTIKDSGEFLSYRLQVISPIKVNLNDIKSKDIVDLSQSFMVKTEGDIFKNLTQYDNKVLSVFENNIRMGDRLYFTDKDDNTVKSVDVVGLEFAERNLPNNDGNKERLTASTITVTEVTTSSVKFNFTDVNAERYEIWRRLKSETTIAGYKLIKSFGSVETFEDTNLPNNSEFVYIIKAYHKEKITSISATGTEIKVGGTVGAVKQNNDVAITPLPDEPKSLLKYNTVILKLSGKLNADSYVRILDISKYNDGKILPFNLRAYVPRQEQFLNGTASRQKEILDVLLESGIVKGLKNLKGLRYVVDSFKSYVEAGYKYQFGELTNELAKVNKFIRCFINEPFYEDLEKSTNPLFKTNPNSPVDFEYLLTGGNPAYSTQFLSKFVTGAENCFWFGSEVDATENEYPLSGKISNLFYNKRNAWDIVANTTGYISGVKGIPFNPDNVERKYMEKFKWNPIISTEKGFTIYGNKTGQKKETSLGQIHNSELLAFIQEKLEQMSRDEAFKAATYDEFLTTEIEYQSFMDNLAQVGAIRPNPVVICSLVNNPAEVTRAKIKVIHIEYTAIDGIEKVVFDMKLN